MHKGTRARHTWLIALLAATLVFNTNCDNDDDDEIIAFQNFAGTLSDGNESGVLTVTVTTLKSAASMFGTSGNLSGTLTIVNGSSHDVAGSYDEGDLVLTAGPYSLSGSQNGQTIAGTYTRNTGGGGGFLLAGVSSGAKPIIYCGDFDGDDSGIWNLIRQGNALDGLFYSPVFDEGGVLTGNVSGSSISLQFSGGSASGTIDGGSVSGTWQSGGDNGTWSGSASQCGGAG